jgi:hypothetical protein
LPAPLPPSALQLSAAGPTSPLARFLAHPGPQTSELAHALAHHLAELGERYAPYAGPLVAGLVVAALGVLVARGRAAARLAKGGRLVRVLAPPEVDPQGAPTLWANLVALLRPGWRRALGAQPHLAFEVTASGGAVGFALWVPGAVPPGLVERAVEAAWPGARTETAPAVPPLPLGPRATGGRLHLAEPEHYPLRTEHAADPLRALLGALSGLGPDEWACAQVLARPVTGRRLSRLRRAAAARRSGRPSSPLARLADLVTPGPTATRPASTDPARAADVAAILAKAAQPCWAVQVHYGVASAATDKNAKAALAGRAHALASAFALFAGRNRFDRARLRRPAQVLAARRLGRGDLVSVAELAALAHLPTDQSVPGLRRAGAKAVAPPAEVYSEGKVLGRAEAGGRRQVALAVADSRFHLHVLGATGSGKSTLLTNLALSDMDQGRGVVVIDPKGDLVADILDRAPARAAEQVVLIDPDERAAPPILNVLAGPEPDLAVDNLVGIFRSIFAAFWGPRTDDVLRAACLTLLRHAAASGQATSLAEVPRLLSEPAFRAPRAAAVAGDKVGLGGFWSWYEEMSEANRSQVIGPVMNKLRAFLLRDFVRQVVGRPGPGFDMAKVLDGGACLVRVPKGVLGDDTARLLGSFVVAKVWQAATHRARLGQAARTDAALYVDECQNFLHLPRSFDEMLAEARGYRLSMVLAHQHLAQLPRDLRDGVSANARTKVFFSLSPEDAHALARHVAPELSEHDLSHLGAYQVAARLVVDGEEAPAFTLRTGPPRPVVAGRASAMRAAARANFGRRVSAEAADGFTPSMVPEKAGPDETSPEAPIPGAMGPADGGIVSGIVPGIVSGIVSGIALRDDTPSSGGSAGQGATDPSSPRADLLGDEEGPGW